MRVTARPQRPTAPAGPGVRARWIVIAAVALLVAAGLGYLRTWPPLATVMSASMAPTIGTGDMVVLRKLDAPPRVGDIVTIRVPDGARSRYGYPPVVIHRIKAVADDGAVTTQGDAHEQPDPFTVPSRTLTTKVVATVPAAGQVLGFLGSGFGLLWLASGALLFVALPVADRYRASQRRELQEREELHAGLQSVAEELTLLRAEREDERREREEAERQASAAEEQLRLVTTALTEQLRQLPAQIERAVAAAVPPPPPPLPSAQPRLVPASQWKPSFVPASQWKPPTPDLMAVLAQPAARLIEPLDTPAPPAPTWDTLPPALLHAARHSGGVLSAAA